MLTYKSGDTISYAGVISSALPTGFKLMGCLMDAFGRQFKKLTEGGYITIADSTHFTLVVPSSETAQMRQGNYKLELAIYDTAHNVVVSKNELELMITDSQTGREAVAL